MDHFKEIPLLESLLNFQKDACNICHITSESYHFTLQNGKQWQSDYTLCSKKRKPLLFFE